jgi:hypothetical protein
MKVLVVHSEIQGSLSELNSLMLGSLGSYGFGYQIEFGRPKIHISKEFFVNFLADYSLGLLGICHGIKQILDVEKTMIATKVMFRGI